MPFGLGKKKTEEEKKEDVKRKEDEAKRIEEEKIKRERFEAYLSGSGTGNVGACGSCLYSIKGDRGEYIKPCKMGHEDTGLDLKICVDCSDPNYQPKKEKRRFF
jgi:hypothetical protein